MPKQNLEKLTAGGGGLTPIGQPDSPYLLDLLIPQLEM